MCSKVTVREPLLPTPIAILRYKIEIALPPKKNRSRLFYIATAPITLTLTLPVRAPETVPITEKETGTPPGHNPAAVVIVVAAVAKPTAKS